jgi:methylmalonyl-CoA/ethylmalonyl-CoA epimerase
MLKKIDHTGIVVSDMEQMVSLYSTLFGFTISESLSFPDEGFKSTLVSREGVTLEIIQPIGPEGIIQKFVAKHGGGLHHISIQVDDINREMKSLKAAGAQFLSDEAFIVKGTANKGAFIHPRSTGGILVELIERSSS